MHIITGMVVAALLGKGKKPSLLPFLKTGPVRVDHSMPGRVRFRVPALAEARAGTALLRQKLPTLDGVREVEVHEETGSVLVRFSEDRVKPELLFAAIVRLLGLEGELEKPPKPVIVRELRSIVDSLNRVIYDRTGGLLDFYSVLLILLAGTGLSRVLTDGVRALPPGISMLWWGLHPLIRPK